MSKRKKNKLLIILIILFITIGFAVLSTVLNINGVTFVKGSKWDVHFANIVPLDTNNIEPTVAPSIDEETKMNVSFSVKLSTPGERYGFYIDVENEGTMDAMIESIEKKINDEISEELPSCLDYDTVYSKGAGDILKKHILKAGESTTLKIEIVFKHDIDAKDLLTGEEDSQLKLSFGITYEPADDSATEYDPTLCVNNQNIEVDSQYICKRATNLHKETCLEEDDKGCIKAGFKNNEEIYYGSCGKKHSLESGNAFVCDINGDGTFNNENELFYYISPKDVDLSSEYVSLIYANKFKIDSYTTVFTDWGPSEMNNLPTKEEWSNVQLSNDFRQIYNEVGTTRVQNYQKIVNLPIMDYSRFAGRLITLDEISYACGFIFDEKNVNSLDKCNYLLEDTNFSENREYNRQHVIMETVYGANHNITPFLDSESNGISIIYATQEAVVKPVIEVLKSKIYY